MSAAILFLLIGLIILLVFGVPVTFGMLSISTLILLIFYSPKLLYVSVAGFVNQLQSDVLLAIPMFVLMAAFLQTSGIGADIYEFFNMWLGGVHGGLAIATVATTAVIAAMSGVAATGTIAMGLIALPEMLKRGYNKQLATGPILAGGTLGPIIPPSTVMIIVSAYSGVSTGKLFAGGIVPGVTLAVIFCIYIYIRVRINPSLAPLVPKEERPSIKERLKATVNVIAPLLIIILVLGCINAGIATPTEASGVGATASFIYALARRKLSLKGLADAVKQTTEVSGMLMWIMIAGAAYTSLVNITRLGSAVEALFSSINPSPTELLFIMVLIYFIMGMFLDTSPITMICVPVFLPIINMVGLDLYQAMLTLSITLCLGMITPPFGVNMFYLLGVTPKGITLKDLYKAAIPYVIIIAAVIIYSIFFPKWILWLPTKLFGA